MYVCVPCGFLVPSEARRWGWIPSTGVTDGRGLPRGCWHLNLGPLGGQLLALTSEPSPFPRKYLICVLFVMLAGLEIETRAENILDKRFTVESHTQPVCSPLKQKL